MELGHTIIRALWLILIATLCDAAKELKNLTLSIEPNWVKRGQSAQLHCSYKLEGAPLYSVKWYRGNLEFYRYSPLEHPPAKIFPYTGIKVDLSVSNATQVTLRNVGFNLSGNFTCEVSADAPSFYTAVATNILTVVELPHAAPTLFTERERYDPGDILKANCSTPPSKPGATITFLLNNNLVSWMRKRHLHILTSNIYTYTGDQRFDVFHAPESDDWDLKIEYDQQRDSGIYECQVNTEPKMNLAVYLEVTAEIGGIGKIDENLISGNDKGEHPAAMQTSSSGPCPSNIALILLCILSICPCHRTTISQTMSCILTLICR